ncbi:MAG: ELWxxDGT repeat protein [Ginsengibacter sp.]
MKANHLLLVPVMLMLTAATSFAQDATNKRLSTKDDIPFGKKLPAPELTTPADISYSPMITVTKAVLSPDVSIRNANAVRKGPDDFRQLLQERRKKQTPLFQNATPNKGKENEINTNSNFHLLKDIDALAESYPRNFTSYHLDLYDNTRNDSVSYAVLNDVIYFVADDGIHGSELWRSDGTSARTFMVKDLEPGLVSSLIFNITAVNGKIYFTAYSSTYGNGAWVSDGTESGTQLLAGVGESTEFFAIGKKVYFIADGFDYWSSIWETDGTIAGTKQVIDLAGVGSGGQQIIQPTLVNGTLFFIFLSYETLAWQVYRSDLTDAGTYHVGPDFPALDPITGELTNYTPAQLTNYKDKLYFSANDGTGRKLWVSDGTDAGTKLVPGNHNVIIDADYTGTNFPIVNNILCVPGEEATKGNGLYKYDAIGGAGLVKIKDFAPVGDTAFIVPREMQVVNNTLYFKVINYNGGIHDELWTSKGTKASTNLIYKLLPGETIKNLYNANGICYFVKRDKVFGSELWRIFETQYGTFPKLVSDIFKGSTSSYPAYLTAFRGKLIFSAVDAKKGDELFITNASYSGAGATLVKDINTFSTSSSNAGFDFYNYLGYVGMAAIGNDVIFNAYERMYGYELYKSDGSTEGTALLNDVIPGEAGFNVSLISSKNNAVFFSAVGDNSNSIYRTNGTKNGLRKMTPEYGFIQSFTVTDNELIFYVIYNSNTSTYELWRTDGTAPGTVLLSSTLYYRHYLNSIGNTAFFVAGDAVTGYELWKSDGSIAGTVLVKDINPGIGNSVPGGMFVYKNEVYFAAYDGTSSNTSFWKSNGTAAGTIKLKDIDPWWGNTVALTKRYFCVSNNILYFSALDYSTTDGTVFWKTDGTPGGTQPIKDINPTDGTVTQGPYYLTDVNGTLFFTADDGVHGRELWKSDGTANGTQLVSDINPGNGGSIMSGLTSFAGKLFFQNAVNSRYYLWTSDGTLGGTHAVEDPGIVNVGIAAIFATTNKLFLSGNNQQYGTELYAGTVENETEKFVWSKPVNEQKTVMHFNAIIYPNPVTANAKLQITGNTKNVFISITDISGRKLWESNSGNTMFVTLPTAKFAAGTYVVTIKSDIGNKTIKLIKQ